MIETSPEPRFISTSIQNSTLLIADQKIEDQVQTGARGQVREYPDRYMGERHDLALTRRSGSKIHARYDTWVGTIRIVSKFIQERSRGAKDKAFETRVEKRQGCLQFKPAPWLSRLGLDLGLHSITALYGSTNLASTLEPVRYVKFPSEFYRALRIRDTNSIRLMLSNGQISLHDKDYSTERSLLDECVSELRSYHIFREDESPAEIVDISHWLISLGLTPNYETIDSVKAERHPAIDIFWELYSPSNYDYDESNIVELRKLFLATADSMPTIFLAKAMVRFAFTFPSQASYMEPLIVDLIKDSVSSEDWQSLEYGFRDFWDNETKTGLPPLANIYLLCLWKVATEVESLKDIGIRTAVRMSILRPVRALLLKCMEVIEIESRSELSFEQLAATIVICKEARILDEGFAEFVSKYACKFHYLEIWVATQNRLPDTMKPDNLEHEKARTCLYPPLRIRIDYDAEQDNSQKTGRLRIIATDPHDFKATNHFLDTTNHFLNTNNIETTKNRLYDSHEDRHNPEVCFLRQEGAELFFDCGISDPEFSHEGHWKDERYYFAEFDRELDFFTRQDTVEASSDNNEVAEAPTVDSSNDQTERLGLVSQLASGGLSIISSIV